MNYAVVAYACSDAIWAAQSVVRSLDLHINALKHPRSAGTGTMRCPPIGPRIPQQRRAHQYEE